MTRSFPSYFTLDLCMDEIWAEPPAGGDLQVQFGDGQVWFHTVLLGTRRRFE